MGIKMARSGRQRGYVLVTVLILAMVASMVAFVSIRENQLQERMSGNQQKMINARLAAEKGIYETIALIKNQLAANSSAAQIVASINRTVIGQYVISGSNYTQPKLSFVSKGLYQDASASLKANLTVVSGVYPFDAGVISCQWMEVQGSGHIDSYDPKNGGYSRDQQGNGNNAANAKVEALNPGGRLVKLDGASPIRGDVTINGSAEVQGSAKITGTVNVANDLNMSGGGTQIGAANVGGNLTMTSSSKITGNANVTGNVIANPDTKVGSLSYGGTLTNQNAVNVLTATNGAIVNQPTAAPSIPAKSCDPLNITSAFSGYAGLASMGQIANYHWNKLNYNFTPSRGEVYASANDLSSTTISTPAPTSTSVFGENKNVYVLDSLVVEGSQLNISGGDVTIVVKGDFRLTGGGANINIASGSSLTVLVQGKTELMSNGKINVADAGAGTNNGKAPMSIYSSYSGSEGVRTDGAFNGGYAAIYAPLTDAKIEGSGTLSGAVRAKTLTVRGAGGLHYDQSLGQMNQGNTAAKVNLLSVMDFYPEQAVQEPVHD